MLERISTDVLHNIDEGLAKMVHKLTYDLKRTRLSFSSVTILFLSKAVVAGAFQAAFRSPSLSMDATAAFV